jgi:thiol-disulfide isomerase/thioredoxin
MTRFNCMSRLALGFAMLGSIAACGADTSASVSPGVKLVQTCTSCKEMKIVLDGVAQRTQGKAHVLIIDISKDWEAANAYHIQLMPTQVFFDASGREIGRHIGKLTEAEVIAGLGVSGMQK